MVIHPSIFPLTLALVFPLLTWVSTVDITLHPFENDPISFIYMILQRCEKNGSYPQASKLLISATWLFSNTTYSDPIYIRPVYILSQHLDSPMLYRYEQLWFHQMVGSPGCPTYGWNWGNCQLVVVSAASEVSSEVIHEQSIPEDPCMVYLPTFTLKINQM